MDAFAQSSIEDRRLAFEEAAAARQLSPQIVEKDFWVCWTLKQLFALPTIGEHLIFKGGTSLSKIFKVIERFSEDIDVSIDRGFLGFGGDNEPEAGGSNKEKQRRIDALRVACQEKIRNGLQPALEAVIRSKVRTGERWSLRGDATDPDGQTLLFDYPSAWPAPGVPYVRQTVKIEMGARADHWPCEAKPITPYVTEEFPQFVDFFRGGNAIVLQPVEQGSPVRLTPIALIHHRFPPARRVDNKRLRRLTLETQQFLHERGVNIYCPARPVFGFPQCSRLKGQNAQQLRARSNRF
jgi:hypothetical protein